MKAHVKSYKEIEKIGTYFTSRIHHDNFSGGMIKFCGKGPVEFRKKFESGEEWFECAEFGYNWHIRWLKPLPKDYQHLLDFE